MQGEAAADRVVLQITGSDRHSFLQGLVTNDVAGLTQGIVYAALLSPQGKYLADFFLIEQGDAILLDVQAALASSLQRRLAMYRLRAGVSIIATDLKVQRGLGESPAGALLDPRHPSLGWRAYGPDAGGLMQTDWDAIRVAASIPETGIELIPDETYVLEAGLDRLHGVDFRKGCYVGQEVTARMRHKTELRKGLVRVRLGGPVQVGTAILADGKEAGTLFTQSGGRGLAHLRFDRAEGPMRAGAEIVTLEANS